MATCTLSTYRVRFHVPSDPADPTFAAGLAAIEEELSGLQDICQACRIFRIAADLLDEEGQTVGLVTSEGEVRHQSIPRRLEAIRCGKF